jgi:hypothetical protein
VRARLFVAVLAAVGLSAVAFAQLAASMPDKEWKKWLEQVHPLMLPAEIAQVKQTPTRVGSVAGTGVPSRFYDGAVDDMDAGRTILWTYRRHPRLPKAREDYTFAFNSRCEWASTRPVDRLLEQAAASYVAGVK